MLEINPIGCKEDLFTELLIFPCSDISDTILKTHKSIYLDYRVSRKRALLEAKIHPPSTLVDQIERE